MSVFAEKIAEETRDRMLDPVFDGKFGALGVGRVFYVVKSTETFYPEMVEKHPAYGDGVAAVYSTIQAALDVTVGNRNDYVMVSPSQDDYDLTAELTMTKKAVHLICPAGLGNERGATNAARIHQNTDGQDVIVLTNSAIEVAGLYFKNYTLHAAISATSSGGVYGVNIHNNTFTMTSNAGAAEPMIMFTGDAGAWGSIESNWMITAVSNATYTSIIAVSSSATAARVKNNEITIGDGCTASIGIQNSAVKGVTSGNIITECGGDASDSGTVTVAISIHASGTAIGNRLAVGAGQALAGGTAAHSFVDNMDGATGAGNGSASNLET